MRIAVCVFAVPFVLTATLAFADGGQNRRPLGDGDLDGITAGSASRSGSGGAIVASASTATIAEQGNVEMDGEAQQGSRALNLVNASSSAVANAVNVWDGQVAEGTATRLNVDQSNQIRQEMGRGASLPSYVRSGANVESTSVVSRDVTGEGSVETVTEVLGQSIQGGQGFAGAASADLALTGGSITITNEVGVELNAATGLDLGGGLLSGSISGGASLDTSQSLTWVLPNLDLHVEGVVCAVAMGSCAAEGTFKSTSNITSSERAPVRMSDAAAEYIAVDGSTLDVTTGYSVALSGSAQQGVNALNLVNAAGSAVSNGVNVARSPTVGPVLNLQQINVIHQTR
jgi:hypothetical protein